ncbi:hypothetical protein GTG28_07155 [Vibrio sp. OCN044]|uniref:Integrin n=1 Tax=Vibrio tetraodonis subsp. pristinus TaxID=2695891 RepID=A0A6L8LSH0_9VIBR|nr:hypothetical protein [Vibrio tetraodonis]MYM58998.1 hypothetical protein [Vibrio tetraodonis subsp. pristinus]
MLNVSAKYKITTLFMIIVLSGCGDSGNGSGTSTNSNIGSKNQAPSRFNLEDIVISTEGAKFKWGESTGANSYTLCRKNQQMKDDCDAIDSTNKTQSSLENFGVLENLSSQFFVIAKNDFGQQVSNEKSISSQSLTPRIQYIKPFNTGKGDEFGFSVSLSRDGKTLAIGAPEESSNATGINSSDSDNDSLTYAGAAYLFRFDGSKWDQQAYIKASNTDEFSWFGMSVDLSADGNTLAVAAPTESTNAKGVNNSGPSSATNSGAVYIYSYDGSNWAQQAFIKASNTDSGDLFGNSIDLSADGKTLAVGATEEASTSTGINQDQGNSPSITDAGAVYLFRSDGINWSQEAYIKASNTDGDDRFGESVALSEDGNTLAVGASQERSSSTEIDVGESNNDLVDAGAVYVFQFSNRNWTQQAYIKPLNTGSRDLFGVSVSLSQDGKTLAVGASKESSNSNEINIGANNNSAQDSGAAYIFRLSDSGWSQQAYIKASNGGAGDSFGGTVMLSEDGKSLAVGARGEDSNAIGANGNDNNTLAESGAAYVFRFGSRWSQEAYIKASNSGRDDLFGSISLSGDGKALAVGSIEEDSDSTGINSQDNDQSEDSGAAYIF